MKALELQNIKKQFLGYEDIARQLQISLPAARVSATRYVRAGFLIRLKKNIYIRRDNWNNSDRIEKFKIANLLQSPSYISLMSAMDYYEITTQMQQNFVESIAVKRTKMIEIAENIFNYTQIDKNYYSDFIKENDFFIATPEKAFLDALYLKSFGKYNFDMASIDLKKLDIQILNKLIKRYPVKTRNLLERYAAV